MEEIILKYRREERERLKTKETFINIIKTYKEMNKELNGEYEKFIEERGKYTIQRLNKIISDDERSFFPDIFDQKREMQEISKSTLQSGENINKLPAPPITYITPLVESTSQSISLPIQRGLQKEERKEEEKKKLAKENGSQEDIESKKDQEKKSGRKGHHKQSDKKETKDDSDTILTSCSDTVEEDVSSDSSISRRHTRSHNKHEKKPKRRIPHTRSETRELEKKKLMKISKEKKNEGLQSLKSLDGLVDFSQKKDDSETFTIAPLNLKEQTSFQPKPIDLKSLTLSGKKEQKETDE